MFLDALVASSVQDSTTIFSAVQIGTLSESKFELESDVIVEFGDCKFRLKILNNWLINLSFWKNRQTKITEIVAALSMVPMEKKYSSMLKRTRDMAINEIQEAAEYNAMKSDPTVAERSCGTETCKSCLNLRLSTLAASFTKTAVQARKIIGRILPAAVVL